jgi:hypothetical protein
MLCPRRGRNMVVELLSVPKQLTLLREISATKRNQGDEIIISENQMIWTLECGSEFSARKEQDM